MGFESNIPLGKATAYQFTYNADLLFPIARQEGRQHLNMSANESLAFTGIDRWTAFELSWLSASGKPCQVVAEFDFKAESPNIIESKSFKLYLNSYNQSRFNSVDEVKQRLAHDLSKASGAEVEVHFYTLHQYPRPVLNDNKAVVLDELDVSCSVYETDASLLAKVQIPLSKAEELTRSYRFDGFRSLCPVTSQPDWASVFIEVDYKQGTQALDEDALLRYLVSFRNHQGFHEQCVEQIYTDLTALIDVERLVVYARFLRRGGLDINPYRSSCSDFKLSTFQAIDRQ